MSIVRQGLKRSPVRAGILLLAMLGSITAYSVLGAILSDMSVRAVSTWRTQLPFDLLALAPNVFDMYDKVAQIQGVALVEKISMTDVLAPSGINSVMVQHDRISLFQVDTDNNICIFLRLNLIAEDFLDASLLQTTDISGSTKRPPVSG